MTKASEANPAVKAAAVAMAPAAELSDAPDAQVGRLLKSAGGSDCGAFNKLLVREVLETVWFPPYEKGSEAEKEDGKETRSAATIAAIKAFKPNDEIEAMLAAQAVALHFGAMECLRRAMLSGQPFETATKLRKDGANLARGMTDMLAALDRKRGKGAQVITVQHVIVQQGGQAVVGNVQAGALQPLAAPASQQIEHIAAGIGLGAAGDLVQVQGKGRGGG